MQDRHTNRERYFSEQCITTSKWVIPYVSHFLSIKPKTQVLEIGCGLGGGLKPFLELGCPTTGIDINQSSLDFAANTFANHPQKGNLTLVCSDIYKVEKFDKKFDLIILRDVIEHIPQQEKLLIFIKKFLAEDGVMFVAFPPWHNPFGGHQQILKNKFLSHCPWLHLLPMPVYKRIVRCANGSEELILLKEIGVTIERFERIMRQANYQILRKTFYFINPNYEVKFNLKPRRLWKLLNIPYLRNFCTTTACYLIK